MYMYMLSSRKGQDVHLSKVCNPSFPLDCFKSIFFVDILLFKAEENSFSVLGIRRKKSVAFGRAAGGRSRAGREAGWRPGRAGQGGADAPGTRTEIPGLRSFFNRPGPKAGSIHSIEVSVCGCVCDLVPPHIFFCPQILGD